MKLIFENVKLYFYWIGSISSDFIGKYWTKKIKKKFDNFQLFFPVFFLLFPSFFLVVVYVDARQCNTWVSLDAFVPLGWRASSIYKVECKEMFWEILGHHHYTTLPALSLSLSLSPKLLLQKVFFYARQICPRFPSFFSRIHFISQFFSLAKVTTDNN